MPLLNLTIDARFDFQPSGKLRVRVLDPKAPGLRLLDLLPWVIGYRIRKAEKVFNRIAADQRDVHYFQKAVDAFQLRISAVPSAREKVPTTGPLIVVANHPLNGIDGLSIAAVISQVRPDLRVMLTSTFEGIPGLADHAIFVNASNGPSAKGRAEPVREALSWLKSGHVLVLFPAGQGSFIRDPRHRDPVDVPWNPGVAMFLKSTESQVLPVFIEGRPSAVFLKTRQLYYPLSTLFLLREILIQEGTRVRLHFGDSVSKSQILRQGSREQQVNYLRDLTYAMDDR